MNMTNIAIPIRPHRLDAALPTLHARQLHSVTAALVGIPDDVTGVVLRIFKTDGVSHFDIPVGRSPNGAGSAYAIGTCFPDAGTAKYEVHAYDARGNMTALGAGKVKIDEFTTTGSAITPGASVPIMQIADATGALHTIRAVANENGEYTTIIDG